MNYKLTLVNNCAFQFDVSLSWNYGSLTRSQIGAHTKVEELFLLDVPEKKVRVSVESATAQWNFHFDAAWSGSEDGIEVLHYGPDNKANVYLYIGPSKGGVREMALSFGPAFSSLSWMGLLDIGPDTTLADITIPGTHDTGTYGGGGLLKTSNQCQTLSIEDQLKYGIRWFDLRLGINGDDLEVYHGDLGWLGQAAEVLGVPDSALTRYLAGHGQPWDLETYAREVLNGQNVFLGKDILPAIKAFLGAHGTETVVICVNRETAPTQNAKGRSFNMLLHDLLMAGVETNKLYDGPEVPKLAGLGGCVVLMRRDVAPAGEPVFGIQAQGWPDDTTGTIKRPDGTVKFSIQDAYKFGTDYLEAKWRNVENQLENAAKQGDGAAVWYFNFTSASRAPLTTPKEIAVNEANQGVNHQFYGYLCTQAGPRHFGTVPMDFPEQPDGLLKLLISMNKLKTA